MKKLFINILTLFILTVLPYTADAHLYPIDLTISDRTPQLGDTVTIKVKTGHAGSLVGIYFGTKLDPANGNISDLKQVLVGYADQNGEMALEEVIPDDRAFIETRNLYYLKAYAIVPEISKKVIESNLEAVLLTPSPKYADWYVYKDRYVHVSDGKSYNAQYPLEALYKDKKKLQNGDVVLIYEGGEKGGTLDRPCDSFTQKITWIMGNNAPDPIVFGPRTVGGSATFTVKGEVCNLAIGNNLLIWGSDLYAWSFPFNAAKTGGAVNVTRYDIVNRATINFSFTKYPTKWFTLTYGLGGNLTKNYKGYFTDLGVTNIGSAQEHGYYFHNDLADQINLLFSYVGSDPDPNASDKKGNGRTCFQEANRRSEGPQGDANIVVVGLTCVNNNQESGGGGSPLSLHGGNTGMVYLNNVTVRGGFDLTNSPVVTNAFVSYFGQGAYNVKYKKVTHDYCDYQLAPNTGDRPFVEDQGAVDEFVVKNSLMVAGKQYDLKFGQGTGKVILDRASKVETGYKYSAMYQGNNFQKYSDLLDFLGY